MKTAACLAVSSRETTLLTTSNSELTRWFLLLSTILCLAISIAGKSWALDQATADGFATNMLAQLGRPSGVWSVPHCGSGELVVALWNKTGDSRLFIDAFENDPVKMSAAQAKINAIGLGLLGRNVYVYQGSTLIRMPYADNFADLIAITDLKDADLSAVSYVEIERALNPGGKAWVGRATAEGAGLSASALTAWATAGSSRSNALSSAVVVTDSFGTWTVITKVRKLPGTDEWPGGGGYPVTRDAALNRFSPDRAGYPTLPQWKIRPFGDRVNDGPNQGYSHVIGVCGGRLYRTVGKTNVSVFAAVNFYNGQMLWERSSMPGGSYYLTPDYLLAVDLVASRKITVLDGDRGVEIKTITSSNFPASFGVLRKVVVDQQIIYALGDKNGDTSLARYDLTSDSVTYSVPVPMGFLTYTPVLEEGSLYFVTTDGVYCYDASTGACRWGPKKGTLTGSSLVASKWGVLAKSAGYPAGSGTFFSATDGRIVWERTDIPYPGLLNDSYAPSDSRFTFSGAGGHCGSQTASPRGVWGQGGPGGAYGVRVTCGDAPWPCNGMMLYPPRSCPCASHWGNMPGTCAEASQGAFSPEMQIPASERLEPGPAHTSWTAAVVTDNLDWFTHRGNNKRSAYSSQVLPVSPQLIWRYRNPAPPGDYDVYSPTHKATSPTTAGGYVYVGMSDGHVRCLDARTGDLVWTYVTGGAVFAAPTVWNGGVYVGAGDGYAYCLEAHTGKLRWRFRAAPSERKMNDWGHLLSSWPLIGGVLVQDGCAYFASGIYDEYGAQVFKVNALTGEMVWQNTRAGVYRKAGGRSGVSPLGTMTIAMNRLWVKSRNGHCAGFDLATGAACVPPDRFSANNYEITGGFDIGAIGDYLVAGGPSVYFRSGNETASLTKLDAVSGQLYPILQIGGKVGFWDDEGYAGLSMQVITGSCNAVVSSANPMTFMTFVGLPDLPYEAGIAGCPNGYINDPAGGTTLKTSLGWTSSNLSSSITLANPAAIDRNGNIIVTLRNGDVACYASAVPGLYLAKGTRYTAPATISMQAYAYSTNGPVSRVEFYNGSTLLKTLTSPSYSWDWSNVSTGAYQLTVKWYDSSGRSASSPATTVIVVPPCAFTATPTDGPAPLVVNFNASTINPQSYSWSFGDGSSATGKVAAHTYASPGNYTATLVANYGGGFTNSASRPIAVAMTGNNHIPVAEVTANAAAGNAPLTVTFDASGSTDADGDALIFRWRWDVGNPEITAGSVVSHTYSNAGLYTALFTADDGRGGLDSRIVAITVDGTAPCGVPGLVAWFDATDVDADDVAESLATNTLKAITSWKDKTHKKHDTSLVNKAPFLKADAIGAKPAVYFPDTASMMQFNMQGLPDGTNPCTMFVVARNRSLAGGMAVRYGATSGSVIDYREIGVSDKIHFGQPNAGSTIKAFDVKMPAAYDLNSNGRWDNGELLVAAATWTGDGIAAWGNDQSLGSTSVVYNTGAGLGYIGWAFGDIGEILIYDRALAGAERQSVQNYLIQKWVTQTDPPVNHDPLASFTVKADQFPLPQVFDASGSLDADGDALTYTWNFGDGSTSSPQVAPAITHAYTATGTYTATLTLNDGRGGTGKAASTFVVRVPNARPVCSITAPVNGASLPTMPPLVITATASDADGIVKKVEFYSDNVLLGSTTNRSMTWTNPPVGPHSLVAKAYDNWDDIGVSAAVNITVFSNRCPTVSITYPTNTLVVLYPPASMVTVTAAASDPDGSIAKVHFEDRLNGSLNGSWDDTTAPYSCAIPISGVGTHVVTVTAYDNLGAVSVSTNATIQMKSGAPVVTITSPARYSTFSRPATVHITTSVSDPNGYEITNVFFRVYRTTSPAGYITLGSDTNAPFSFDWVNPAVGTYYIMAYAYNLAGTVGTAAYVPVYVVFDDGNTNGISDTWEIQYFGSTDDPRGAPDIDWDGDGLSNLEEYLAGTDPTNAGSVFAFSGAAPRAGGSNLVFSWMSASGKFYSIHFATSLLSGFTGILSSNIPATPPVNTYTAPVNRAGEFYRIRLE